MCSILKISSAGSEHPDAVGRVRGSNPFLIHRNKQSHTNIIILRQNLFICHLLFTSSSVLLRTNFTLVILFYLHLSKFYYKSKKRFKTFNSLYYCFLKTWKNFTFFSKKTRNNSHLLTKTPVINNPFFFQC